jgi:hypothetical protein
MGSSLLALIEDETGLSQAIVHPDLFRDQQTLIVSAPGIIVEGVLQNLEGQPSVRAAVLATGRRDGDGQPRFSLT